MFTNWTRELELGHHLVSNIGINHPWTGSGFLSSLDSTIGKNSGLIGDIHWIRMQLLGKLVIRIMRWYPCHTLGVSPDISLLLFSKTVPCEPSPSPFSFSNCQAAGLPRLVLHRSGQAGLDDWTQIPGAKQRRQGKRIYNDLSLIYSWFMGFLADNLAFLRYTADFLLKNGECFWFIADL